MDIRFKNNISHDDLGRDSGYFDTYIPGNSLTNTHVHGCLSLSTLKGIDETLHFCYMIYNIILFPLGLHLRRVLSKKEKITLTSPLIPEAERSFDEPK